MKNILIIYIFLVSNMAFAISRSELLSECAAQAEKALKKNYFPLDSLNTKLRGLTTWLSAENLVPPTKFKFTHIADVQLQDSQLMNWDFQSITELNEHSCRLVEQIKTGELVLEPPSDCENCNDDQD